MCENESLNLVKWHPRCAVDYTYESLSNSSRSCLDHFIVSDSLYDSITKCHVLHDGDNLSDHSVVYLVVAVDVTHSIVETEFVNKTLWWKATNEHLQTYMSNLDNLLSQINIPVDTIACRDRTCMIAVHSDDIQKYHDDIIRCCLDASQHIPVSQNKPSQAGIPGWNEHVRQYRESAMFWHRLWKDNNSPQSGVIFDIRRKTRFEYHRVLRAIKRHSNELRADKMASNSGNSSSREFWNEFKRTLGRKSTLPCSVDDTTGVDDIATLFQDKYNELYNSVSYNPRDMDILIDEVNGSIADSDVVHIGTGDVHNAISLVKPRKSDGYTGHSTDHLIHGTPSLHTHLSMLFSTMVTHGYVPLDLRISTLIPIPKNKKKSLNVSNNYRAIALSSVLGKTLDHILLLKYRDNLFTSDLQYGFKKHHSTTQCTFVLNEVIQYYLNNDSPVNVVLLDASRAFDRVNYVKLFRLLLKRNLCPLVIRFMINMYTNQSIRVRWGSCLTTLCDVSNGVKQGGVISPILFTIYVDELLSRLKCCPFGCHIGQTFCGALGYADDVVIMAPTVVSLDKMLDICRFFAEEYDVCFNSTKSKLLIFNQKSYPKVNFMGQNIEGVPSDKHLGNIIGHQCNTEVINDNIHSFIGRTNSIKSHFHHIHHSPLYSLFKTMCMPLYGSQIWDLSHKSSDKFLVTWRKSVRSLLNLPYTTHSAMLPYICDDIPLLEQLYRRVISFTKSLHLSSNHLSQMCYRLIMAGSHSAVSNSLSIISEYYNVPRLEIHHINCTNLTKHVYDNENAVMSSVVRDLLTMRYDQRYGRGVPLDHDEIECFFKFACTF